MLREMFAAGFLVATLGLPSEARSAVTIKMTGSVYHLTNDMANAFKLADPATAWFRYDPKSVGTAWYPGGVLDPSVYFYENAPLAGGMSVGSYKVKFGSAARMFVTNNEVASYGWIDRVLFDDFDPQAASVNGRPLDVVSISFQDNTATVLDSLELPSSAAAFAGFPMPRASLDWQPYIGANHRVSVVFNSITVSAVPEPATWAMMISGLLLIGYTMRRRRWHAIRQ